MQVIMIRLGGHHAFEYSAAETAGKLGRTGVLGDRRWPLEHMHAGERLLNPVALAQFAIWLLMMRRRLK
jgi:hypothetical protein